VMDSCRKVGCDQIIMVIGHQADVVREVFAEDSSDVVWVEQTEQLGTGHAVMVCQEHIEKLVGPVLVLGGDGPLVRPETLDELISVHVEKSAACSLATSILPDPAKYGRIVRDENGGLVGIVEYLDATEEQRKINEVNVSIYCFDAQALAKALPRLANDNAKGEYYLTDILGILAEDGGTLAAVASVPPVDTISINTLDELAEVDCIMAKRLGRDGCCCSEGGDCNG